MPPQRPGMEVEDMARCGDAGKENYTPQKLGLFLGKCWDVNLEMVNYIIGICDLSIFSRKNT